MSNNTIYFNTKLFKLIPQNLVKFVKSFPVRKYERTCVCCFLCKSILACSLPAIPCGDGSQRLSASPQPFHGALLISQSTAIPCGVGVGARKMLISQSAAIPCGTAYQLVHSHSMRRSTARKILISQSTAIPCGVAEQLVKCLSASPQPLHAVYHSLESQPYQVVPENMHLAYQLILFSMTFVCPTTGTPLNPSHTKTTLKSRIDRCVSARAPVSEIPYTNRLPLIILLTTKPVLYGVQIEYARAHFVYG